MCKSKEAHSFCAIPPCYMCLESCFGLPLSQVFYTQYCLWDILSPIYLWTCVLARNLCLIGLTFDCRGRFSELQLFFSDDRDVPSSKMLSGCSTGVVLIYKKHITFSITAAKIQMLCKDWVSGNKLKMQIMQIKSRTRHNYFNGLESLNF